MLDFYDAILGAETIGGGGGGSATLITKNIDANGTYSASSDNADGYSAVTVTVPNTYTQSDEGKVVDNGALVAQTSSSTTSNGTVDTTTISSLTVNVANSYTQADNGKVVSNQQLVAQTAYPSTITTNNTYDTTNYNSITVNVSGGGATTAGSKDVNFYDYNGNIVYSYTASEFAQLSALPANPTHTGLTSQGWNWTLSDAQSYVSSYGIIDIGQMYITDDGKTRFYIEIDGELYQEITINKNNSSAVIFDWGDNTTTDSITGSGEQTASHTYSTGGKYIISIDATNSACSLEYFNGDYTGNKARKSALKKVEIGSNFTLGLGCLRKCYSLSSVTLPNNAQRQITNYMFEEDYCLNHINIPNGVAYISEAFPNSGMSSISIPKSVTVISGQWAAGCKTLNRICYPPSLTMIDCFLNGCNGLSKAVIPNNVTSIVYNAFTSCYGITDIIIPSSVTSIGNSAFQNCFSLSEITIPSSVTTIGTNVFQNCNSLKTITIDKAEGSITGAPWGAPSTTQVVWTG